ncbi:DNA helicase UvrD [Candidatus Mycoplasma haematobovis]|uniref:DNA 3'-5' helicase n=1 Tax=Candidatus Mycoplasma haematobovis TaxID=432608 RepID=A0A1A9QDL8_9MOLU|nr:ATP-dependent helicase [Candidatus Mycoplasma haematobovis]OAL10045.1 DNA helicase UvrD [Candidatus Mycoplasma haematobovis]
MALNPKQTEAVTSPFSPTLVIAGAGTGKTTVLIERIIHLISNGIKAEDILAITFTNKAKEEVSERIARALPNDVPQNIYTFHAFFHLMLRKDISKLGRNKDFRIVDENDQRSIIRNILKDLSIDTKATPRSWINIIGELKHRTPFEKPLEKNEYAENICNKHVITFEELKNIYASYTGYLKEIRALDFNDLEILVQELLNIEEARTYWSNCFKAILIDEFQDINDIQFKNIKKLLTTHENIFCVGDPDQSIYGFRGAKPDICKEFLNTFKNSNLIKLEENYRSTKNILAVANHLINKNSDELSKVLFTNNEVGSKIIYKECHSDREEAEWVMNEIRKLRIKEGAKLRDIAILYRSNNLAIPLEMAVKKYKFDYSITNSVEFYAREEVRYITAYLSLIFNDYAYDTLERIISKPVRGIGEKALATFITFIKENNYSIMEAFENIFECNKLSTKATNGFKEIGAIISNLRKYKEISIDDLIMKILNESGYRNYVREKKEDKRIANIIQFASILSSEKGVTNEEIVRDIALRSRNIEPDTDDYLLLSTVHQVKGLEFKYVFVIKMTSDVFPSKLSKTPEEKEEERRLAYVAFTRAKKRLFISKSSLFRGMKLINAMESEFISEIKKLDMVEIQETNLDSLFNNDI